MSSYDEVDIEDMDFNAETKTFTYMCPCGDFFFITAEELRAGEEIAHCPSCSLLLSVVYDPDTIDQHIQVLTKEAEAKAPKPQPQAVPA